MKTDTIAAIATGLSNAGISIIRISGEQAIMTADKIFKSKKNDFALSDAKSHTMHYGYIHDEDEVIDEVLVSIMRAPNTYTKEDVVEVNCHGGIYVTKKILELILKNGARAAEPGEFTKRAFLNGRIDLSQAEAIMDIIQAKSELALKNSVHQLKGNVHDKISDMRKQILLDTAFIEAALDDPEHIELDGFAEKLEENTKQQLKEIEKLLKSYENGKWMKEGIKTVILGKPNAGKSSLLNLLLGENRAIVTDIAGTTRDTLEESISINGIPLNIVDTAGIRWTNDVVERIGVDKAKEAAADADLILYVCDSSVPLDENDVQILKLIEGKKAIILLNKSDLDVIIQKEDIEEYTNQTIISMSTHNQSGLADLEQKIAEMFFSGNLQYNDEIYITNIRQKEALYAARESLMQVVLSIEAGMPEDFFSIDLMNAYQLLGNILGEEVDEDLVNTIFKEFCMGK